MSEPGSGVSAGAPTLTCPRHKVETPLTCVTCGTPICPKCYVRTAVGLRCPKCAEGVSVKIGGPRWPVIVPVALVGLLLAFLAVRAVSGGSDEESGPVDDAEIEQPADGATPGYRLVNKPEQGYSIEVPVDWQAAADNTDTTLSYAKQRATEGSLRVSVGTADGTVAERVERLIGQLTAEGGVDFAQTPTTVGGQPGIRLTYRFPSSPTPGSTLASRSSYLVAHDGRAYSVQLSTTDPGANESVFAYIASSFKLL
ncbi:MAG: hypothetical protein ACLGI2_07205 [Acidimicrobiia bacterium]